MKLGQILLDMLATLALVSLLQGGLPSANAASVASKNKEGNRLFEQGKYQDAEKAYVAAQLDAPGRSELLYNLGNALIKQKKHEEALRSLRQAINKGNRGLQANSWYNAGNALFEMNNFSDAAQAFIQSLRINPADRDAKHNLELALKKLQEQKQMGQGQDQNRQQQNKDQSGQNQQRSQDDSKSPSDKENRQQSSADQKERDRQANPQTAQADRREGSIDKERALQILDALQNQELAEQRKLLERQARRKATGKDW